jgi:hypothetical protein
MSTAHHPAASPIHLYLQELSDLQTVEQSAMLTVGQYAERCNHDVDNDGNVCPHWNLLSCTRLGSVCFGPSFYRLQVTQNAKDKISNFL